MPRPLSGPRQLTQNLLSRIERGGPDEDAGPRPARHARGRSENGGSVPDENIDTLINEGATYVAFFEKLLMIDERLDSGDIFYIYFSGHGDAYRSDLAFK